MTIPPSRLRRATSLYTREALLHNAYFFVSDAGKYEFGFLFGFGALIISENMFLLSPGSLVKN